MKIISTMNNLLKIWSECDTSLKELGKQMKDIKTKRDEVSELILSELKKTKKDSVDISATEQLVAKTNNVKSGLSAEYIEETLTEFYKLPHTNDPKALASECTQTLLDNREINEKVVLRKTKKSKK